jgi:hypothetical protein
MAESRRTRALYVDGEINVESDFVDALLVAERPTCAESDQLQQRAESVR